MIIHITTEGDLSTGISGDEIVINWNANLSIYNVEEREELRKLLTEFFYGICDNGRVEVWFEDECPDCHTKLEGDECQNKGCVSYGKDK